MSSYDDFSCEHNCRNCEEKDQTKDNVVEYFEEILEQLYGLKKFNAENLEHCLDEMAYFLGIRFKFSELKIQEKKESVPLNAWIHFNNTYLKSLT